MHIQRFKPRLLSSERFLIPLGLDLRYASRTIKTLLRYPDAIPKAIRGPKAMDEILQEKYSLNPIFERRTHGFEIFLDTQDMGISPSIGILGWYELRTTELFIELLREGFTAIDVGANTGFFTLLAAKIVGKRGVVISFEPEPSSFSLLSKSVQRNNFTNVRLYQESVSNAVGKQTLHLSGTGHKGMHSLVRDSGGGTIAVAATTLDEVASALHLDRIDLLKIDVEGSEPEVLSGATKLLSQKKIRNMILEWEHPEIWAKHEGLVRSLLSSFDAYEVTRSLPFLPMKRIREHGSVSSLFRNRVGTNLYLKTRK